MVDWAGPLPDPVHPPPAHLQETGRLVASYPQCARHLPVAPIAKPQPSGHVGDCRKCGAPYARTDTACSYCGCPL